MRRLNDACCQSMSRAVRKARAVLMARDFAARERVLDRLGAEGVARFPFSPHGRIPNFAGAHAQTVDGGGMRPATPHPADIVGQTPRLAATPKEGAAAEDDTWRDFALAAFHLAS
jgi:hypothetical protein